MALIARFLKLRRIWQVAAQRHRQAMEILVLLRQRNIQLLGCLDLFVRQYLLRIESLVAGKEEIAEHPIQRFAIVALEVVRPWYFVHVPAQGVFASEQFINRPRGVQERRWRVASLETAVVVRS